MNASAPRPWISTVAVAGLLVAAAPAEAEVERLGDRTARRPALAAAGDRLAAAWIERGRPIQVALARRGRRFGPPRSVPGSRGAYAPRIAVNARGDVLVAWTVNDRSIPPDPYSRDEEYCCLRVSASVRASGGSFSAPRRLSAPGSDGFLSDAVLSTRGRASVMWEDHRGTGLSTTSRGRRLPPGDVISPNVPFDRVQPGDPEERVRALAPDAEGGTRLLAGVTAADGLRVKSRPLGPAGGAVEELFSASERASLEPGSLFASARGAFALGFVGASDPTGVRRVFAAAGRRGAATTGLTPIAVYAGERGYFGQPQAAVDDAGDALVAVGQATSVGAVLHVARRRRGAARFARSMRIPVRGSSPPESRLALDGRGRAVVAWTGEGSSFSFQRVYLAVGGARGRLSRPRLLSARAGLSPPAVAAGRRETAVAYTRRGVRVLRRPAGR